MAGRRSPLCVRGDGTALGGVSRGCVEGAVYDLAWEVLDSGRPQFVSFADSDDAFATGLTCGGEIGHLGSTRGVDLDLLVLGDARLLLGRDDTVVRTYDLGVHGATRVLFEAWSPEPRLLVFEATPMPPP
ncbi:XdhC family protein [Streptomyces yokosukanensis]|uniref:XdhC family protein n=1 Tax=Streptomyces yokosukanensis TaxID=67386 RepID=UPI003F4CDAA4